MIIFIQLIITLLPRFISKYVKTQPRTRILILPGNNSQPKLKHKISSFISAMIAGVGSDLLPRLDTIIGPKLSFKIFSLSSR